MSDDRITRIRAETADNLKDSVWYVDGSRIEAADRFVWLDMQYLLDKLDAATSRYQFTEGWSEP